MKKVLLYLGKGLTSNPKHTDLHSDSNVKIKCSFFGASINKKPVAVQTELDDQSQRIESGTKDETFFDSQAWLESDSEDFYSVQGDSIPSLKASPVHQKKSLSELFCESFDSTKRIDQSIFSDSPNQETPMNVPSNRKSGRHCFPGLVRSISCREWKKKRLSPVHVA